MTRSSCLAAMLAFVIAAACAAKPPSEPPPGDFAKTLEERERFRSQQARTYAASFERMHCDPSEASATEDTIEDVVSNVASTENPGVYLALAKRAARCSTPAAAMIVFKLVPALLLARYDGAELTEVYRFLRSDRARAIALFKTLLSDPSKVLDFDPKDEPRELRVDFRPEVALGATCSDLAGIVSRYAGQFRTTYDILERNGCNDEARAFLLRSLRGSSNVRAAACERAGRFMPDLRREVAEAAATDPGEPVYETSSDVRPAGGLIGVIIIAIMSPITHSRSVKRVDYRGRLVCELVAEGFH